MLDILKQHAIDTIWCSPEQDYQAMIKPHRLSRSRGTRDFHRVMWRNTPLPTQDEWYHLYQIGHVPPKLLGLCDLTSKWERVSDIINRSSIFVDIYFNDGVQLPRFDTWICVRQNNVLLAVKEYNRFLRIREEDIYIRLYSNAFYQSDRSQMIGNNATYTEGRFVMGNGDVVPFQNRFRQRQNQPGAVFAYVNGIFVDDLNPSRIVAGDIIEYIHDQSIYREYEFKIKDLSTFESLLDEKRKYLLNPLKDNHTTIDYYDDIDIYLYTKNANNRYNGIYYHRHQRDAVRNLTHKDYSIPVSYLNAYAIDRDWPELQEVYIRMFVRHSGYDRPLSFESHRTIELYKLDDPTINRALLSIDSNVPEWQAANLENSFYTKLMRHVGTEFNPIDIQLMYGYNAMSKILGDTPQAVLFDEHNHPYIDMPPAYMVESTVYEYDQAGKLINYWYHESGLKYSCRSALCRFVEVLSGRATQTLDITYGQESAAIYSHYNYRAYLCTLLGDTPLRDWTDVTNSNIVYVDNDRVHFDGYNPVSMYSAVISDRNFIGYTFQLAPKNGVLKFSINVNETHNGETDVYTASIPMRRVDVWFNKHPLIEGLDFHMKWPEIVIVNNEYFNHDSEMQEITIRASGFTTSEMKTEPPREYGFIRHGYLSKDHRYNIRDDKVLSIVVGGKLRLASELDFAEDSDGVILNKIPNGTPYAIREHIVSLKDKMHLDTYALRHRSMDIDRRIEDYLTVKYPQAIIDQPSMISERYKLHSPFLSRVIDDLIEDVISDEPLRDHYSNLWIKERLSEYEYLLEFDPAHLNVDTEYVVVLPHRFPYRLELNYYKYNFIRRVAELYFNDTVDISAFISTYVPVDQG